MPGPLGSLPVIAKNVVQQWCQWKANQEMRRKMGGSTANATRTPMTLTQDSSDRRSATKCGEVYDVAL